MSRFVCVVCFILATLPQLTARAQFGVVGLPQLSFGPMNDW